MHPEQDKEEAIKKGNDLTDLRERVKEQRKRKEEKLNT